MPRSATAGFAALVLVLAGFAWLADRNIALLRANDARVIHSQNVISTTRQLLRSVVDAETGQRGYLLTGDAAYAQPLTDARGQLKGVLEALRYLTEDDPAQQERLDRWQTLTEAKLGEMAETIRVFDGPGGREAALKLVRTDQGRVLMRDIRAVADEFVGAEEQLLAARDRAARENAAAARWTLLAVTAVAAVMAGGVFGLVGRDLAARQAAAEERARLLEAERAARADADEHARRFRLLAETMVQMVWTARPDGVHTYFNHRWTDYTGLTPEESFTGWHTILHPDDHERTVAVWQASRDTGKLYEIEYRFRARDGTYRWFLARAAPLRDPAGAITQWVGTCTDIDDQKRFVEQLEAMVRERTAELERSNRALQDFATVASHDLQEPLRKIQAFGDRLNERCGAQLTDAGKDYLGRVLSAAGRMSTLINDLLAFSRVTTRAKPFEPVDLNRVARDVVGDLEVRVRQTGGRVELGELPELDADPTQMRQLFQNLIGNALKFHKPGVPPVVCVGAERAELDGRPAWKLAVADNGTGFDSKYVNRIYEVFQRLHGREYEGTGIGLAIVRKIVERHGGTIAARSAVGEGATFEVTLPARKAAE